MAEHWTQIPLLKYSPGRVLYYKKNLIEIGDPQLAYSPCKLVRALACKAGDPGSNPGREEFQLDPVIHLGSSVG